MELFERLIYYKNILNDYYPNLGVRKSLKVVAENIASKLSFEIHKDDIVEVCARIQKVYI